ncbi:MAG: hypothetical protein AB1668_00860 [Nanoarchaeota archaeon]
MNHKIKTILVIIVLLSIIAAIGLLLGKEGITGGTTAKMIACYENGDCNDKTDSTEDVCKNPGTEYSLCVNKLKD